MILSVSRRTDIPALYGEWFMNRLREGFAYVRNPFNPSQIREIILDPTIIDCIVFWTKSPSPLLPHLQEISELGYGFYFQVTLTPYGKEIEQNLPSKDTLLDDFQRLAGLIGPERVVWRYDPILLTDEIALDYHIKHFSAFAKKLAGSTTRCILSFVDFYTKTQRNTKNLKLRSIQVEDMEALGRELAPIGAKYGLQLCTCSEAVNLAQFGIEKGTCIDAGLIEAMLGRSLHAKKDRNQRLECGCVESIDLGAYNTCSNQCLYCYANHSIQAVRTNITQHDPCSPLLIGNLREQDRLNVRRLGSTFPNVSKEE